MFLPIIFYINLFFYSSADITIGKYPYTKRLNNGYFIIVSEGIITFTDPTLTEVTNSKELDVSLTESNIGSTTVSQFPSSDNGYILVILVKTLYVFSSAGDYLAQLNTDIVSSTYSSFIIPNGHSNNQYYFTLIYGSGDSEASTYIIFQDGIFDSSSQSISLSSSNYQYQPFENSNIYSTMSCHIMVNNNQEYIACIYGNYNYLCVSVFDKNNNHQKISTVTDTMGGQYFKSAVLLNEMTKSMICGRKAGTNLQCLYYDITTNTLTPVDNISISGCQNQPTSIILEYFSETQQFVVGCRGERNQVYLSQFSKDFNFIQSIDNLSSDLNAARVNVIFPKGQTHYSILYHKIDCSSGETKIILNIESFGSELTNIIDCYPIVNDPDCTNKNKYYNYEKTECIDTIENGFYCNDTIGKTIDKCHDNCKTCEEGPTSNNNKCLTCKEEGTTFFDLGNCVGNCEKGSYMNGTINTCYCSINDTCKICSIESNKYNLCETCNSDSGYYPMESDNNNIYSFVNCYNTISIPVGYYLEGTLYKPCHDNCLKCIGSGSDSNNNCIECKSGLTLKKNDNNVMNCYTNCDFYFYFRDDVYSCTTSYNCPSGYKLIEQINKCIDDCSKDNIYKYEYKNVCYESCPQNTTVSSTNEYLCELKCELFNKFYNYEETKCIENVPNGYYIKDNSTKKIDMCHENCYTCNEGPSSDNNNCISCPPGETGKIYYD
jgi:hypothetical protein